MIFRPIGGTVVLNREGVYFISSLYELNKGLYAEVFGGYVRLHSGYKTSSPQVHWSSLACRARVKVAKDGDGLEVNEV